MNNPTIVVISMILAGTTALAGTNRYAATLAQPLAAKKEILTNHNAWLCEGSTCVLASHPDTPDSVRTCRELQRAVGTLTAYGIEGNPFDATKLAACNAPR